jgi:CRISPR-associated protein Cmr5
MSAQTLEQKRAKHALDQIKALKQEGGIGNYVSYVNALPAAILMNGLGQALATECAAGEAHRDLANHVAAWLLSDDAHTKYAKPVATEGDKDSQRLLSRMVAGGQDAYVWAQAEAIAYVTWLKTFANAFLKQPDQGDGA